MSAATRVAASGTGRATCVNGTTQEFAVRFNGQPSANARKLGRVPDKIEAVERVNRLFGGLSRERAIALGLRMTAGKRKFIMIEQRN